jgi:hypothetical protein
MNAGDSGLVRLVRAIRCASGRHQSQSTGVERFRISIEAA